MKYNLYLYNFNNYYNRKKEKFDTLLEYGASVYDLQDANFNIADGIHTEHVFNVGEDISPDYCILCDTDDNIVSRWFVIENGYTRYGQYRIELFRDVIADGYDNVINSPCFIEKATLGANDPMIFNSENMSYNQIKKEEHELKDETGVAWLVGYWQGKDNQDRTATGQNTVSPDIVVTNKNDYSFYSDYNTPKVFNPTQLEFQLLIRSTQYANVGFRLNLLQNNQTATSLDSVSTSYILKQLGSSQDVISRDGEKLKLAFNVGKNAAYTQYGWIDNEDYNNLANEEGKIVFVSSENKYYKVKLTYSPYQFYSQNVAPNSAVSVAIDNVLTTTYYIGNSNTLAGSLKIAYRANTVKIELVEMTTISLTAKIPLSRVKTHDQPYDIFCIPFPKEGHNFDIYYNNSTQVISTVRDVAWTAAMALARDYGGSSAQYLYDLQLLPYCPVRGFIKDGITNGIDVSEGTVDKDYTWIVDGSSNKKGVILFASSSNFSLNVPFDKQVEDVKVESECDTYRLCSPNYAAQFEFNLAKNGGINYFNVDCTYKPYTPYIHVNPDFKMLYGEDFDDARGLICGGNFSVPMVNDAWSQYELANKNYQNSFNRQIENMEIKNKYQRVGDITNAITGTVTGAVSGAVTGAAVGGGPLGAGIGAAVGGVASAAGGVADIIINEKLRNEAIDYTKDQFGYQLENIQALPYTLSSVGAFTKNNKLFPILEYYTCTDEEKQALKDKIKYNGMTVMRIGKIKDFLQADFSYIKGKIIRLEGLNEDFHFAKVIAEELNKGVFIK